MAPEKCNYKIFSKNHKTGTKESLEIYMFGKEIKKLELVGVGVGVSGVGGEVIIIILII